MIDRFSLGASLVLVIVGAGIVIAFSAVSSTPAERSHTPSSSAALGTDKGAGESTRKAIPASPAQVALSFGAGREAAPSTPPPTPEPPRPAARADWMRLVGTITDSEGTTRLFVKDLRKDRVVKIRLDGTAEGGARVVDSNASGYIIELDGVTYAIAQ